MARRGRKPKSVEAKEFLINNDKDFNSWGGKKGMIYSSAAKFMNIMPTGESHTYMTPVKKGERLGKGKYRIVAHYPNKQSDDRDSYESTRKSKDLVYDNDLTKPSRIKYDGIVGTGGYHLITHDRDGKRVEFILGNWAGFKNTHGDAGFPIFAEMYLPDKERRRSTGKKLMACPVKVGTFIVSNSHPGEMKLEATKPKGECAKFGNSNAKKHQVSPLEYEKAAETEEHFMSEGELLHFYSMNGVSMDAEDLLSNYQAIDSVIVDRSSYQPAQDYGAETSFSADTLDEFCASCGEHKAEGCGGCHAAEEDIVCPSCGSDNWGEQEGYSCRDCNHVFNPYNAESDAATYAPSNDPDMVNSIPTEPTNAEADLFGAESKNKWVKGKNGKTYVLRKKTGHMVTHNAESPSPTSPLYIKNSSIFDNRKYDARLYIKILKEAGATKVWLENAYGWSNQPKVVIFTGLSMREAEKALAKGVSYGERMMIHSKDAHWDAESPGGAYPTLEDFNGLESVVVEPPLGHGVAQWYAEGDSVTYSMAGEVGFEELEEPEVKAVMKKHGIKIVDREAIERVEWGGIMGHGDIDYIYFQSKSLAGMEALDSLIFDGDMKNEGDIKIVSRVRQRNAEGDAATYSPSNEPDMVNEIQTEPTNANFEGENFDEVRTGFNYGIGGYLGFTSIAVGSLMIANLIMERFGKKTGE